MRSKIFNRLFKSEYPDNLSLWDRFIVRYFVMPRILGDGDFGVYNSWVDTCVKEHWVPEHAGVTYIDMPVTRTRLCYRGVMLETGVPDHYRVQVSLQGPTGKCCEYSQYCNLEHSIRKVIDPYIYELACIMFGYKKLRDQQIAQRWESGLKEV